MVSDHHFEDPETQSMETTLSPLYTVEDVQAAMERGNQTMNLLSVTVKIIHLTISMAESYTNVELVARVPYHSARNPGHKAHLSHVLYGVGVLEPHDARIMQPSTNTYCLDTWARGVLTME